MSVGSSSSSELKKRKDACIEDHDADLLGLLQEEQTRYRESGWGSVRNMALKQPATPGDHICWSETPSGKML